MELYLSACSKTANVAANKAASSSVAEDSQQCREAFASDSWISVSIVGGDGPKRKTTTERNDKLPDHVSQRVHKTPIPGVGAAQLLDLPLGVKLPMIPGTDTVYYTTNISEKLFRPSYGFNLSDPYCRLLETQYKSLHDPHLRTYYKRKDILRRLKKGGYITSNNKIVCSLRELNKYRQYLTSLKLDFERNYLREQKNSEAKSEIVLGTAVFLVTYVMSDITWKNRRPYLDMISKELEQLERTTEEQRLLRMDREERRQREYTRKKLNLRRKIEEEWKTKEMLLLTKIGEDVKREQRVEEQRRRSREESDRKKQAMLEKKMAYHLQKMQNTGLKDDMGRNAFEYKGQNGAPYESSMKKRKKHFDDIKVVYPDGEDRTYKGTSVPLNTSARDSVISAQNSPTKTTRLSHASLGPQKEEGALEQVQGPENNERMKTVGVSSICKMFGMASGNGTWFLCESSMLPLSSPYKELNITSDELNGIIQNIMTWVVATVTSILYPAIIKYEERVQSSTYPVSDDSDLSSDSSSFCSTCSEGFTYRSFTAKTFQAEPCMFAGDVPVKKPPTPLKPPSAHVERTVIGKTYQVREQSISSQVNYNKTSLEYPFPKIGSSKSDSHLLPSLETSTKKSKDASTETDSLESPFLYNKKSKAMDQMKNLKNVFVNFKCHLKGETQLILESIFQEIMSDLTQAIPSLSSVTAEVFVDPCDTEREDMLSNVDICSVASEIVENMLEKLESAVERKCVQIISQEDLTIDTKPTLSASGEYYSSLDTKTSEETLAYTLEPMCDVADDMVHTILEKLMTLASYKKSELPPEDTTKHFHQQIKTEPPHKFYQKTDQKTSSESDAANQIVKEEIQNLISNIFSQSSLVGYVEEAISTILGYVQTELNNERLIASEETVVLLQLLDDVLTQLHRVPAKADVKKHRQPRVRNLPDAEEKYRLAAARTFNGLRTKKPFPPINVPGMVLYSEDDDEEIDNLVKSVLDSSFTDEKIKSQEQVPNHWPTKRDTYFESKRSHKLPTKPTCQSKVGSHDWGLKLELSLSSEDIVRTKHRLTNDPSIFSQDQKYQIQKASENIVKHILTEMLKDMSSVSSHHPGSKIDEETSAFVSEKSQGLSDQEWMEQHFSGSEICAFAHEITDSVINILHKASKYIPKTIKNAISSVHQTCPDHSDTPQTAKEIPNKTPFKVWFDSEKKMKYLSSLNVEIEKSSQLRSGGCEPKRVNDITDKIINTIFKRLKLFICPKLHIGKKSLLADKSLHSQLSTYTMKIVNIVLDAIQNELELSKIIPNLRVADHTKCRTSKGMFADSNETIDSHVKSVNDIMESPLLACIFEMISSTNEDQSSTSTSTDKAVSTMLCGSDNVNKQNILSSKQDKNSFRRYLATPCLYHSVTNGKDLKESPKLQVLEEIGETLHEMLSKLTGAQPDSQSSCSKQSTEKSTKDPPTLSNVQLISKAILEYVLAKLCDIDIDSNIVNSGLKTISESLDIDSLSFASTLEEMAKCTNIISNIISKMMMGNKDTTKNKAKGDIPGSSKTENSKEMCPNKLKTVALDILNMVFTKLEGFASGNMENDGGLNDEEKKENETGWELESKTCPTDSHDKSLQSTLYTHAKRVSSAILKAIQTELNINPSDCKENMKSSPQETQMLTNIVDLVLDVVSKDMFTEADSESKGIENYRYRPVYGNFLPGGAESESFLDDDTQNREFVRDITSSREETRTFCTDQWVLERTLSKIEVKLKEPQKSPIVPIIRNILNEIFQSALINQLNTISISHPHFSGMPHNVPVSTTQTSQFMDPLMAPLVSDADVTVVVNDVVRTVFHKLYSAATTEKHVSENSCETIIFSTNVSFREHAYPGNGPVRVLNENPCDVQSSWNVDRQTKINVVEDIVQAILENLETFAASKVESLFHPQVDFRVPVTLAVQQEEGLVRQTLSGEDSHSDEQFPCCSVSHSNPGQMESWCQLSFSKLNIYAKEVARKILQGIKHELDKEQESPLLTNNLGVSENIASQVVNTVLDIVSCRGKRESTSSDRENSSDRREGVIERLVNKAEYRKILEFQIQDTIEGILCDIYENIIYQNNPSFATPTLQYSIPSKHSEANYEPVVMGTNIIPKVDEEQAGYSLHPKHKNLAEADVYQVHAERNEATREPAPDPCEENANFITETIFNRLQSFATERINSLMTPASQSNKENVFVSPAFENGKQDDSFFHESDKFESDVNVLKLSTTKTDPSQELAEPVFASCRENFGTATHLSQTGLRDYAVFIASAILKLIKNDLDLEMQSVHTYSNNILFQKNVIVSEIVDSILKLLHNKGSLRGGFLSSPEKPGCSQLTIPNEVLLGYQGKEKTTTLPPSTNDPLGENPITTEKELQRAVLEEVFMRKGELKPREKTEIFSAVEEVLKKLSQNIMEIIGHLPPFNEMPYIVSKPKSKTSNITQKRFFQSHINSLSNDILENILGEMHSVVVTSLYKKTKSWREVEMGDNNGISSAKPLCFRETNPVRKRSNSPRVGVPQEHLYADNLNVLVLENALLPYSPLQIGKYLVQIVLDKLSNFVSLHLEKKFPPAGSYDDMYLLRLHNSKLSPKNSPRPGCKTSLKARSKITSLSKLKTRPHLGICSTKSRSKTKLSAGERSPRENRSKTAIGLPQTPPTADAQTILKIKLPASELTIYAKNIITDILEIIMKELERVAQKRAMLNTKALPTDQIFEARKIINEVLHELYATNNHSLASPSNVSNLGDFHHPKQNVGAGFPPEQQACFYLENVSSQLEQIFPKEGIFKKMFDKWQTETSDTGNEKSKLLTVAENILTEISIKAKDLEYSLSLLNLPPLEDCENRFYDHFKGGSTRAEDTKSQINMFGREIVEMLFEKLQLCFLSQLPTQDSKGILPSRKERVAAKSKHGAPTKHILTGMQTFTTKMKDQVSMSHQIVQEIVERVLNMLESFVDLKFKHISKYEFSEIVKMPIDNLFQVQQRPLSKKMLPKLHPFRKFSDELKPSTALAKETVQDTLLQVHSFHAELLRYSVTTVSDMLSIIKNKLDTEISQMEPYPLSILKENIAASEIIGTLIDQCTHFSESLITNLPNKSWFKRTENVYIVNQVEFASHVKMPTPKVRNTSVRSHVPQRSVSGLGLSSENDTKEKYEMKPNSPTHTSSCVENKDKSPESMGRPNSKAGPSCSRNKEDQSQRQSSFGLFEEVTKGNNSLPEGSVLQKLFKKANDSTEESLKQVMSFIEMGKGENPRVFHYETAKPIEPSEIKTNASPLKICVAADNIVNTVLSSYGFPHQPYPEESLETMRPFFMSGQNPLSAVYGGQKNEKNLLQMWCQRMPCIDDEKSEGLEACQEDLSLLHKWKNKSPNMTAEALEDTDKIVFVDNELGPNEMHLVARHVATSVVTHLKNARAAVICYLISNISDGTKKDIKDKAWEIQDVISNKYISIHSQVYKSRSVSIGELALSIFEVIIDILSNGNIISVDKAFQASIKPKYRFCPGLTSSDFDDIFQDLLKGVIFVLSKGLGINRHFEKNVRNKPYSTFQNSVPLFCKANTMESQIDARDWESCPHLTDYLAQRNKLNYLTCRLNSLVGNLKSHESKEVVNEVFNIVLDLFLPDEFPDGGMSSGKLARTCLTSNNQQGNRILTNNLGLSPKSIFLLNIVCEKLIRTLLEKFTGTAFLEDSSLSRELAEECQHVKLLRSAQGKGFDYCKAPMDYEQFQGDYMSDVLENLADMDQDVLSSDHILNVVSHSLVKSLMDKLSHGFQQAPFENKCMNYKTGEIQPFYPKAKRSEFLELGQTNGHVGFVSYDNNVLSRSLNNPSATSFKMQAPCGKQHAVKPFSLPLPGRQESRGMNAVDFHKLCQRGVNGGVYSATFLEDIISELFFKLSTSLWRKNTNITETWLNEINTSLISNVVNDLNDAQITVLRYPEERLYFPSAHKGCVTKIVDSIYYDVLQQYEFQITCGNNLPYDNPSVAGQMSNRILLEIVDYQLPSCFKGKLKSNSYHTLNAGIILHKLQNNLRKFISEPVSSKGYSTMLPHSFLEYVIRRLLAQILPLPIKPSSLKKQCIMSSDFDEMSNCITNKVMSAISKHKIWFTICDDQNLHTDKNLQKMKSSSFGINADKFIREIVTRVFSKIFSPKPNIKAELENMTQKIVNSVNNHLDQAKIPILCDKQSSFPFSDADMVDELVTSIYRNVLKQHGLDPDIDESENSDAFVENITKLITAAISDYLLHPLFSGDLSAASYSNSVADNTFYNALGNIIKCSKSNQSLPPYNTLLPYTFLDDMVSTLLSKVFPFSKTVSHIGAPKDKAVNFNEIASNLISDIRTKISQHEIRFSKDEEAAKSFYSEDDVRHLVDSVSTNILENSDSQESLEQNITKSNDVFIDKIAGLIIKYVCEQHLQPFLEKRQSSAPASKRFADKQQLTYASAYSSTFLEDVVSGVVSKIFHRVVGIVQVESTRNSEAVLFDKAEALLYWITEEFSKAQVTTIENAEERLCISAVRSDVLKNIIDTVYSKVLEEYEMEIMPHKDFLNDTKALAGRITKIILTEIFDFQIPPDLVANLPLSLHSKLSQNVLVNRVHYDISKSRFRRQASTIYTTMLSHIHLEKIVTQLLSQISPTRSSAGPSDTPPSNLSNTVMKLINEIMSIISKHAICIVKHGNEKQSMISEKDIQSMVDSIYADLSHSNLYQSLTKDKKENMIYKLLANIFPSDETTDKLKEGEDGPDDADEFMAAASKLTEEILKEISEHEIRFATEEETAVGTTDNFIDSICNNILKNSEFQAEIQKGSQKKGGSFLSKIAGFIIKEIMDHHLRPFLYGEGPPAGNLADYGKTSVVAKSGKEKAQPSLFSAAFLEDVIVDLAHKFCSFASLTEDSRKRDMPEPEIVNLAINFANSLIREFRKSEIKVLPHAEEIFSFPPIGKETVDEISNFVYDQFIGKLGSDGIQKSDNGKIVIEMVSSLAQKAISAFKIQPLLSGDWCSTFFSFLDPESISQRVQRLPRKTSMQISRSLKQTQLALAKDLSMRKDETKSAMLNCITTIMKSNIINLMSGSTADVTDTKKDAENKPKSATQEHEAASKAMSPATSVKSKETQAEPLTDICKSSQTEKENLVLINEQGQMIEIYTHYSVATATVDNISEKEVHGSDFVTDNERKVDNTSKSVENTDDKPKSESKETMTEKIGKTAQQPVKEERMRSVDEVNVNEEPYSETERVQNVIENIYDNVLIISSQEPLDISRPIYSKSLLGDKTLLILQDSAQPVTAKDRSPPVSKDIAPKKKASEETEAKRKDEGEVEREKEIKSQPKKTDHPPSSSGSKPTIIPAKFLEDVITEMVDKLVFTSPAETKTHDRVPDQSDKPNQDELYDTAMRLIDSMLKQFSDAEIKVFRPEKGTEIISQAIKESSVHTLPAGSKEASIDVPSSSTNNETVDKVPSVHKTAERSSSDKMPSVERMPSIEKSIVNKIVHSCVCDVLKECTSQESICKNINSNGANLAKRLTSTVISEIFQHQLNLIFSDEVPASACVPLETKDVEEKVQKVVQTVSKECQTSSPYTIKLPFKFLDDVISALLAKVFSKLSNVKTKISQPNFSTQLDFLQMKLVSTVAEEIAKNEDMIIQYVESLHPNDDEIIQLVVQTIYNNLLPQFGSQETIQDCIVSGCKLLSKTVVDLVLREVAGNQLQNYFGGELTPYQCAEVDNVVENILTNVALTTPSQPRRPCKLSYNVIEAIAVKFLSKLLLVFPKMCTERTKSQETEMQKISSKILKSIQECISKKLSSSELVLEAVKIMEKVVKIIDELKSQKKSSSIKDLMLDSRALEEALALFLAKLVKRPGVASKDRDNLTKPELNKIASQLTKSVTAEISRSNISLVDSNSEEQSLDSENIEMISQVIESVYNNIIKQSGTHNEIYDVKDTKKSFPKKVASLIVDGVSNVPSCRVSTKSSYVAAFGDLDTNRIIEKAQKHAAQMNSDSDKENKTERKTHLIGQDRTARCKTLREKNPFDNSGSSNTRKINNQLPHGTRTEIVPANLIVSMSSVNKGTENSLCAVGRNSFQNVRRPDVTRVELLKDIHNKKELIIRLVAHDISQKASETSFKEDTVSDEEEIVLGEVVGHQCFRETAGGHAAKVVKHLETQVVSPKTTTSTSSLRKFLALSKCCHPTSGENIDSIETTENQMVEPNKTHVKRAVAELDMASSKSLAEPSSREKLQYKKEEILVPEPPHYFIHRIMSTSSYNQEDLLSG
ncbi:hypothetical protein ACRRTK_024078 [Alexandromys fortis]